MRKTNIYLIIALALAIVASLTLSHVDTASAQAVPPVGVVVAYAPGQSITIVDQQGNQHEYMLSTSLKILPPGGARVLGVGSFVTIIAPASLSNGKEMAVGIVVHPHVPPGWKVPDLSATPAPTETPPGALTATPTGTILTTETATPPVTETTTATPAVVDTPTDTPTPTATPMGGGTTATTNTFIDWLRSLLRQLLTNS